MKTSSRSLAMRDVALAAVMGVGAGADFGADSKGPQKFGILGADFGVDFGASRRPSFGDDSGLAAASIVGPSHPSHPMNPANQGEMMALWQNHKAEESDTARRRRIINPNEGSTIKINRYSFTLSSTLTLATPSTFNLSGAPNTNLRPERITCNTPISGMVYISTLQVGNIGVSSGTFDSADLRWDGVGQEYDTPTLTPSNQANVSGNYTGEFPATLLKATFLFTVTFKGPSTMTAA